MGRKVCVNIADIILDFQYKLYLLEMLACIICIIGGSCNDVTLARSLIRATTYQIRTFICLFNEWS